MTTNCHVSLDGGQINIEFYVPAPMTLHGETALQSFIDNAVNSQFVGQVASQTVADDIRALCNLYSPLIYMLIQLGVHT